MNLDWSSEEAWLHSGTSEFLVELFDQNGLIYPNAFHEPYKTQKDGSRQLTAAERIDDWMAEITGMKGGAAVSEFINALWNGAADKRQLYTLLGTASREALSFFQDWQLENIFSKYPDFIPNFFGELPPTVLNILFANEKFIPSASFLEVNGKKLTAEQSYITYKRCPRLPGEFFTWCQLPEKLVAILEKDLQYRWQLLANNYQLSRFVALEIMRDLKVTRSDPYTHEIIAKLFALKVLTDDERFKLFLKHHIIADFGIVDFPISLVDNKRARPIKMNTSLVSRFLDYSLWNKRWASQKETVHYFSQVESVGFFDLVRLYYCAVEQDKKFLAKRLAGHQEGIALLKRHNLNFMKLDYGADEIASTIVKIMQKQLDEIYHKQKPNISSSVS